MALKFGVKLVMYGENQAEYGNNIDENNRPTMDKSFFTSTKLGEIKLGGVEISEIMKTGGYKLGDFVPYLPPPKTAIEKSGLEVHYLGYYLKWDPQECYYYAVENTGFEANTERTEGTYSKYSSIDDRVDPFHYFTTLIKFGLGRASYDAAQEIRNGKITRNEGCILVQKFDQEFPNKYFLEFLEYIGCSEREFWDTVNRFRSPHLWMKEGSNWVLRHQVTSNDNETK
jgi:hypothetical protein